MDYSWPQHCESLMLVHAAHFGLSGCHKNATSLLVAALLVLLSIAASVASEFSLLPDSTGALSPAFSVTTSSFLSTSSGEGREADPASQPARERNKPDWDGILRDTGVVFGSQIFAGGIIYLLPESISGWSKEEKRNAFDNYDDNVRRLAVDKDKFYINYILHPYWGSAYYIRARERGVDKDGAVLYSTLMSAMWEFSVESLFEKPSIQDLIVTPAAGSLIGIYLFEPLRASIKRKQQLRWYDEALLVITDPLGVVSSGIERMLGVKTKVSLGYSPPQYERSDPAARFGLIVQFPLQ